ncbi:peptidoglycan DD-metalloendopeptidase family protein [Anabaena subtropica]|uniref:peptidoglycan DD-metalloendopeptidase family protein n=1 Tax=Anabaena subtropica TaxID=425380 RepID=UPI0028C49754|nr:peptidoglycan DD-metalloendopeptidase family protein [Anabaena subtropica]
MLKNTLSSDNAPADQLNVANNQASRRARRQAAMIGLAISMGATSLLVTRQSDQAQAAAPVGSQKAASTIPKAADLEVKSASTKLGTPIVLSSSAPENPVIVEPTAVSQLPGLEAKWQVLASGMSGQLAPSENLTKNIATHKTTINQQLQLAQGEQTAKPVQELAEQLSSVNGVAAGETPSLKTEPQIQAATDNAADSGEINARLKAQQEFALNRLQEKSSRLRKSLAELRSEESKDLSKTNIELTQQTTASTQLPQLNTNSTVIEQPSTVANGNPDSLATTVQQPQAISIPVQPVTVTTAPTENTYEVKPGDTLAAIASRYNTSVAELVKANNLSNPNQLQISQQLIIPGARINTSTIAQAPVIISSSSVQYPSTPKVVNPPVDTARVNPILPVTQPPFLADSTSVPIAVPTPNAANSETPIDSIVPPESEAVTKTQGVGGNTPIPSAFIEIQQPQKPAEKVARAKNERLRGLQAEIQRLQEKYRAQQSGDTSVPVAAEQNNDTAAVPIPVTSPSNFAVTRPVSRQQEVAVPIAVPTPLAPSYSSQPVKPEFRATLPVNEPLNPEFLPNQRGSSVTPSRNPSSTRVTTPPPRTNASESLGRMRGTTVSPKLPPLAAVDQYLPQTVDESVPPPSNSSTAFIWPAKGVLTSGYGWRWGRMHRGIDIANAVGTPVLAAADGVVEKAGWNKGGYGILVDIRHPDGSLSRYAHNSKLLVRAGQQVNQGQQIALMGNTGFSTGPHTHFEIHESGKGAVNPIAMLPATTSNRI